MPLALARAGSSSEARIAMMAMTTSNSIRVKPNRRLCPASCFVFMMPLAKRAVLVADQTIVHIKV